MVVVGGRQKTTNKNTHLLTLFAWSYGFSSSDGFDLIAYGEKSFQSMEEIEMLGKHIEIDVGIKIVLRY